MRRVLAIILAFLIPLQSAMGAIVPIAGVGGRGCEQRLMLMGHQGAHNGSTVDQSDCKCNIAAHGGAHGTTGNHACPHLGMAIVAIAPSKAKPHVSASALPETKHTSFVSIVLDVPSPPPTLIV